MSILRATNGDSAAQPPAKSDKTSIDTGSQLPSGGERRLERRREHRYPACEIVEVQIIGASGGRFGGMLLDVSRSGLKIEVGKPLSQGAHLEILLPSLDDRSIPLAGTLMAKAGLDTYIQTKIIP